MLSVDNEARSGSRLPPIRQWIGKSMLVVWIAITMIGLAALSVKHMASLPDSADEVLLTRAMLQLRKGSNGNFLVHVIYAQCSCSRALFAHLLTRRPFPGAEEAILLVGTGTEKREAAERAGFTFLQISAQELVSRFGLEAAPVLIAIGAGGQLRYVGGYFAHPAAITPLDRSIYLKIGTDERIDSLPVFGCAVSSRLEKALNPLGLSSLK
jgi:hypothetical protein